MKKKTIFGFSTNQNLKDYFVLFRQMMKLFCPLLFTTSLQYFMNVSPIMFVGQLSSTEFDGVSFAVSLIHIFGTSVGYGLTYACDTVFSQAFGSSDKKRTGFYLQKSLFIAILFPFPYAGLLLNIDHLMLLLGQNPKICEISSIYIKTYLPALPLQYGFFIISRYMQNQNKMWPTALANVIGNVFNIIAQYVMLYELKLGFQASAVCMVLTFAIMLIFEIMYLIISGFYKPTWPGWSIEPLYDWMDFLRLAIPGIGYAAFEQVNWEIEMFMAGLMGIIPMAVHSVLAQTGTITCGFYVSLSITINVMIGQSVGSNKTKKITKIIRIAIIFIICISLLFGSFIAALHNEWPWIFTSDSVVNKEASMLLVFYPIYYVIEATNAVLGGIMRAYSKHTLLMCLAFGCMYLVGIPLAAILAFLANLKVAGMWIGNTIGLTFLVFSALFTISFFKWDSYAQSIQRNGIVKILEEPKDISEDEPLLCDTENKYFDLSKSKAKLPHIRMPSHSMTSSSDLYRIQISLEKKLTKEYIPPNYRWIIIKRVLIYSICVALFFIGLITHFTFRPNYSKYSINVTDSHFNISAISH